MPLTVEQLLQREALRRDLQGKASRRSTPRPCIALSRFPFSDAAAVGTEVARQLDFSFLDIEIVDRMARDEGLPRAIAAAFDEHVRSGIERYVMDAFREGTFLESDYLRALVRTVRGIGEAGGAVLLGRGSPYILPPERTLRVLVVAPREVRGERLAKERNLGAEEAVRTLIHEDEERTRFLMHHFRIDPDDPTRYDLAVNTGILSRESASEVILAAYRGRFSVESVPVRHVRV